MKNVLMLVHDDAGQEARFQAALDVVRTVEGHLICLDVAVLPELIADGYGTAELLLADERQRESVNRTKLEQRLGGEGLPWNWIDMSGNIAMCLEEMAALADLIVINRQLDSFPVPDMRKIAGEVLIKAGTPMLAVPDGSRGIRLLGHAMIAWDGSAEASEALREAVPLLKLAQRVTVIEIVDGSVTIPCEEAAAYLSRQGIFSTVHPTHPLVLGAAGEILKLVKMMRPDYLVMGAYSHCRTREALFGGVTRRMLTESPVPLFLAH